MKQIHPGVPLWQLPLSDYLKWLEVERREETSAQTLTKYLSHLRGLLDYAWRAKKSDRNVLEGFRLQDATRPGKPRCLSIEEAKRLVEACPTQTALDRRDRMMILLLYGCGLRTGELCRLRLQDVDRQRKEVFIEYAKGDRQRFVPIPQSVLVELLNYLLDRGGKQGPLFRTQAKRRALRTHDVCEVVRQAAGRVGLDGVTPKVLRHSYATHLMDRGVDLGVIASLMGHRSVVETGIYLHVLEPRSEEAVDHLSFPQPEEDTP